MRRLAPDEKEVYEKKKKHKAKIADDAAQRNAVWCKYPLPVKSNLVSCFLHWFILVCVIRHCDIALKKGVDKSHQLIPTNPTDLFPTKTMRYPYRDFNCSGIFYKKQRISPFAFTTKLV